MQTRLTEKQIENLLLARNGISAGIPWFSIGQAEDFWNQAVECLDNKIKHRTSDGKPYVEPEPPIPEGYRKANADEYKRRDVQFWHLTQKTWMSRRIQGEPFDPPKCNTYYIVPADPPLTDEDACVWPRLKVMVRDADGDDWQGPFFLLSVNDSSWPFGVACKSKLWGGGWKQARRATPEEIEAEK